MQAERAPAGSDQSSTGGAHHFIGSAAPELQELLHIGHGEPSLRYHFLTLSWITCR